MSNNTQSLNNTRLAKFRESLFDQMNKHILSDQQNKPTSAFVSGKSLQDMSIGIIGGGMTGLYAGMLLDSLGVNYTIFEASDPGQGGRDGGRVYTHYFDPDPEKHQYAELGPMRFPDNPTQSRLFNFWHYLNSTAANTNNATQIPQIPYILFDDGEDNDSGNLLCYNNMPPVTRTQAKADNSLLGFDPLFEDDKYMPFKSNGKLLPASTLLDNAIEPFLLMFEGEGIEAAWQALLQYDGYSARFYLETVGANGVPYPPEIVDYIETVTSYTGVFDMALLEIVLDNFTFGTPSEPDNNQWFTFDGGTSRLTVEMLNRISPQNYQTGCMVNALQQNSDGTATVCYSREGLPCMSADFDYVFVTVPFNALRFIDTPTSWSAGKYQSIRTQTTINAQKVALGFKSRFWEQETQYSKGMKGGQSNTDFASRSIVYPSFGIGEEGPAYVLTSYCWERDADKFAHLSDQQKISATLRDLCKLHGEQVVMSNYLGENSLSSIVWETAPNIGCGFGFFSEGQFGEAFINAKTPEGAFSFGGEHLDMMHYWIAGSFNSAVRCVWEALIASTDAETTDSVQNILSQLDGGLLLPSMVPTNSSLSQTEIDSLFSPNPVGQAPSLTPASGAVE